MLLNLVEFDIFSKCLGAHLLLVWPVDWNPKAKSLSRTTSKFKRVAYHIVVLLNLFYCAFLVYIGWPYTPEDTKLLTGQLKIFLHATIVVCEIATVFERILIQTRLEDFSAFIRLLQSPSFGSSHGQGIKQVRVFQAIYWGLVLIHAGATGALVLTRGGQFHIDTLLPVQHRNLLTFLISCTWASYLGLHGINAVKISVGMGYLYYVTTCKILRDACTRAKEKAEAAWSITQEYRTATILTILFNQTSGSVFVPVVKTGCEIEAPLAIAMCFKFSHDQTSMLFLVMMIVISVVATASEFAPIFPLATIHELSRKFLDRRQTFANTRHMQMLARSCYVLRNQVGSFYYVDRPLVLTMLKNKIDMVIFLLLNI